MSEYKARNAAKQIILSGFRHHSYDVEKDFLHQLFSGGADIMQAFAPVIGIYDDVLAPGRLRSRKNGVICLVTIISRAAIEHGMDAELSFALSDYYLNEIEESVDNQRLGELRDEILKHYRSLADQKSLSAFSLPVAKAIRYMRGHLYEPCKIRAVAEHAGITPSYLAVIFKSETGVPPSEYLRGLKLAEAAKLLQEGHPAADVADALGYYDLSHFSNAFKKHHGVNPTSFLCK